MTDKSKVMKKAWLTRAYTGKSFDECLKDSWSKTVRVTGKEVEPVATETVEDFGIDFIGAM